jgi:AbrB family looped-hinge helix DNA binding protein
MRKTRSETTKVGKRGVLTIPATLRKRFGFEDGSLVIAEEREDGILLRPAVATPVEAYNDERIGEFLLSNAIDADDYQDARREVISMGLNPDDIGHRKPAK